MTVPRFPIREYGLNYAAQPLQKHEIKAMTKDETIMRRVLVSYQLMLDFYGMRLEDEATGLISRSKDYAARYRNLCSTYPPVQISFCSPDLAPGLADVSRRAFYASLRGPKFLILSARSLRTSDDEPMADDSAALRSPCRVIGSAHRSSLFLQQDLLTTIFASPGYSSVFRSSATST